MSEAEIWAPIWQTKMKFERRVLDLKLHTDHFAANLRHGEVSVTRPSDDPYFVRPVPKLSLSREVKGISGEILPVYSLKKRNQRADSLFTKIAAFEANDVTKRDIGRGRGFSISNEIKKNFEISHIPTKYPGSIVASRV